MALSAAEEALVRELIAENPQLLSLADNEATIISKLGATKKNLSELAAALSLNDTDLAFVRQGSSDKSVALSVLKAFAVSGIPAASETVSGIAELATTAEANAGTDDLRIMTPLKTKQAIQTFAPTVTIASTAEAKEGTNNTNFITPLRVREAFNASGSAPVYAARAWCNFNGVPLSGTYSQSGTTITVTMTAHGMSVGQTVSLDFTTGTAVDASFTVATVADANTFTVTAGAALTTSGNVTRNLFIRGSGNISSIADNGVGIYTINFATALPDANYGVAFGHAVQSNAGFAFSAYTTDANTLAGAVITPTQFKFYTSRDSTSTSIDVAFGSVTFFR